MMLVRAGNRMYGRTYIRDTAHHSETYCEYIALQTDELHDQFITDHRLFLAERIIADAYYHVRNTADDNPYSIYFAKQTLVSDLNALHINTAITSTALAQLLQICSVNIQNKLHSLIDYY